MDVNKVSGNIIAMLIVAIIMLGTIVIFPMIGFDLTPVEDVHLEKVVSVEGFTPSSYAQAFCSKYGHDSTKLEPQCNKLNKDNCTATSCCVYAMMDGAERCLAGDRNGPTFKYNEHGKSNNIDYFFFKNKCYGKACPE